MKKTALKKDVTPLVRKAHAVKTDTVVEVRSYARKIWLAGLGAYAKAGKEGLDYVKELIKAGEGVEKDGKKVIDKELKAANSQIDAAKDEVAEAKGKVEVQLDKLEKLFDVRVASALNRIGIPSRHDVDTLSAKLDKLTALVERAARKP
ncbi:phasin family protein [Pseudomonas sp. MWU16-30317]|uniref:phasin family protein n=1 Tax=Pseudomonas sp. MWU16-30317 TaxID=2878095 RepID=UPI001CFAA1A1|nr:phasin family protein [Pseudomonas sp. MWU16-30317]